MCDLAADYAFGLVKTPAFTDANERTAWAVCASFLKVNRARMRATVPEIIETVVRLAAGHTGEAEFAARLRAGVVGG